MTAVSSSLRGVPQSGSGIRRDTGREVHELGERHRARQGAGAALEVLVHFVWEGSEDRPDDEASLHREVAGVAVGDTPKPMPDRVDGGAVAFAGLDAREPTGDLSAAEL